MQGNSVDPGAEAGLTVEAANIAEDLDEYFLCDVGCVCRILQAAGDDGVDRLLILSDELAEGTFGPSLQLLHKSCFVARNRYGTRQIAHQTARLHTGCP